MANIEQGPHIASATDWSDGSWKQGGSGLPQSDMEDTPAELRRWPHLRRALQACRKAILPVYLKADDAAIRWLTLAAAQSGAVPATEISFSDRTSHLAILKRRLGGAHRSPSLFLSSELACGHCAQPTSLPAIPAAFELSTWLLDAWLSVCKREMMPWPSDMPCGATSRLWTLSIANGYA